MLFNSVLYITTRFITIPINIKKSSSNFLNFSRSYVIRSKQNFEVMFFKIITYLVIESCKTSIFLYS